MRLQVDTMEDSAVSEFEARSTFFCTSLFLFHVLSVIMLSRAPSKKLTGPVAKISHEYETWLKSTVYSKANVAKLQILAFDVPDKTVALAFGDENERFQLGFKFWDTYPNDFTQERKVILENLFGLPCRTNFLLLG